MNRIILSCILLIVNTASTAQNFYYYKNEKIKLELNTNFLYVLCNVNSREKLNERVKAYGVVTKFNQDIYYDRLISTYRNAPEWMTNNQNYYAEVKLNSIQLSEEELLSIVSEIKKDTSILNVSFHYNYMQGGHMSLTNYLWVQVQSESQIPLLVEEAKKIDYFVLGQNLYLTNWVMLGAKKEATFNPLKASNYFVEQHLFAFAEPDMLVTGNDACVNDSLFATNQTELNGGGTWGPDLLPMDIQTCAAWNYTTGQGINIAVMDDGFENMHPDLAANVVNTGYDAINATTPTAVIRPHGTACAGIAAAKGNNSLGITGVAYNSGLMSISFDVLNFTWVQAADAFGWARTHGADVISNSWNANGPSTLFDAAVILAQVLGRNGKGCVVVFSTNNFNMSNIQYPSNSNSDVVAVGATDGSSRASFPCPPAIASNYGPGLDIMAPGVNMATTDRTIGGYNVAVSPGGDYITGFCGTSAACPVVAGVAALILSANPCLTQFEVGTIINRTASKMGNYSYSVTPANPDGSWNNEMGYGLIDARAAVIMAQSSYLQNTTNTNGQVYKYPIIQAGYSVSPFVPYGNYSTTVSSNVQIEAKHFIDFQPGSDLQGNVDAHLSNSFGSCDTW